MFRGEWVTLLPPGLCILGSAEDLTEDPIVVGAEDHLVIVDQANKFNSHFLQLLLHGPQPSRDLGQLLLMTPGQTGLQEGLDAGLCNGKENMLDLACSGRPLGLLTSFTDPSSMATCHTLRFRIPIQILLFPSPPPH